MSPIVFLVFAPVAVVGLAFIAFLLGAASAGVWETVEERARLTSPPTASSRPPIASQDGARRRAA